MTQHRDIPLNVSIKKSEVDHGQITYSLVCDFVVALLVLLLLLFSDFDTDTLK